MKLIPPTSYKKSVRLCHFTYWFEVYDGAVGHDCVVSLHQVQLAAAVLSRFVQTVDGAALGAGADGHAWDGLITAHTVHRSCPAPTWLQLLETEQKEQRERQRGERERDREGTRERPRDTDRQTCIQTDACLVIFSAMKVANVFLWLRNPIQILF